MRLWHQHLISHLPRQQLLGAHRECCALRGAGWGKKHATVDYVFTHIQERLVAYHFLIMREMRERGYHPDEIWNDINYRGKTLGTQKDWCDADLVEVWYCRALEGYMIYPEHNEEYLQECLDNLKNKGIDLYEVVD